ncbi:MAG TPA: DegT/DnrJ/EryC1/StrS family aminotransferase [Gaiellaceae bacterium]|nr:DegT/DnrJ/EryC1/StrS family aminotransferase [Gaiellaceae bacterium]
MQRVPVGEPVLGGNELAYVTEAVESGWISSLGRFVTEFEAALADEVGTRHVVAVANGTAALHLGLVALGVGPGDEVVVPSFTFVATAAAVRYAGATPVFVDCDPRHWCLTADGVAAVLSERTRAIVPVHIYGHAAPMDELLELADAHGVAVLEDAAEALGARHKGRPVGALGAIGAFSFYGNKLITTGEGGALTTDDDALADRLRLLRDHAMAPERRYWHDEVGFNYRMTNLQGAVGVAQMERMAEFLARKIAIAAEYALGLSDVPGLELQEQQPWCTSACWMTTVRLTEACRVDRDTLAERLGRAGIDTRPTFQPVHEMPPYRSGVSLPVTEALAREGLSLPSGASLSEADQQRVIEAVRTACHA